MNKLHEALDDLTTYVPEHVQMDAGEAWRSGRRRRTRRHAGNVAAVVAVLALLAGAVVLPRVVEPPPAGNGDGGGVTSYPTRIGHQWFVGDLPDRPGPVAALIQRGPTWEVVSPTGHRWMLIEEDDADLSPALSPDGTTLVWLDRSPRELVIHDLVTGEEIRLGGWRDPNEPITGNYYLSTQHPHFWSPDGSKLLLAASPVVGHDFEGRVVVDVATGALTEVPVEYWIAGWYDDDSLVSVRVPRNDLVRVKLVGLDGSVEREVDLRPARRIGNAFLGQWGAAYSPETDELLVVDRGRRSGVHRLPLTAGTEARSFDVEAVDETCAPGWAGGEPYVTRYQGSNALPYLVDPGAERFLVTVEQQLEARCLIWAADAIGGSPNESIFGTSDAWWAWYWRELLIGAALVIALGTAVLWWRRRPRKLAYPDQ